jgi:hypothetical protein
VQEGCCLAARREDELGQGRQVGVELVNPALKDTSIDRAACVLTYVLKGKGQLEGEQ